MARSVFNVQVKTCSRNRRSGKWMVYDAPDLSRLTSGTAVSSQRSDMIAVCPRRPAFRTTSGAAVIETRKRGTTRWWLTAATVLHGARVRPKTVHVPAANDTTVSTSTIGFSTALSTARRIDAFVHPSLLASVVFGSMAVIASIHWAVPLPRRP